MSVDPKARLTSLTKASGCAAKLPPDMLTQVLGSISGIEDENILVGFDKSDDACVYRISDTLASVMTVDFFPPMVDDPYTFGQIAAANALSDIYAMGARPSHALNLLCFPACLGAEVAGEILRGGADKAKEAGCAIAGGHTIADDEPKYGLCVHGFVDPSRVLTNAGALEGDALILTKKLGTGVLTTALKGGFLEEKDIAEAVESMKRLNKTAAEIAAGFSVHACTDITGFSLIGHTTEMARGSALTAEIHADALPLMQNALEMARMGMIPKGAYANMDCFSPTVRISEKIEREKLDLAYDPQTSGGLLLAVGRDEAAALLASLKAAGLPAETIGCMGKKINGICVDITR